MTSDKPLLSPTSFHDELTKLIVDELADIVAKRGQRHRLKVTDLPSEALAEICKGLRARRPECEAYVLSNQPDQVWMITSTKLIELRNVSKKVIVIFSPPSLRTSAEDSFALDNFERYPTEKAIPRLLKRLQESIPPEKAEMTERVLTETRADEISRTRYLLALEQSTYSEESIGMTLFHLGLIPDRHLPAVMEELTNQLARNSNAVEILSNPRLSTLDAVSQLSLKEPAMSDTIIRFMREAGSRDPSKWLPKILDKKYIDQLSFDHWTPIEKFKGQIDEIEITNIGTNGTTEEGTPQLDLLDSNELKVTWETNPIPTRCEGLDRFSLELVKEEQPVSSPKIVKKGSSKSGSRNAKLNGLVSLGLDEGLYSVRVRAWAEGNTLLKEQISEPFAIRPTHEPRPDDETPRPQKEPVDQAGSMIEAYLRAQAKLIPHGRSVLTEKRPTMVLQEGEKEGSNRFTDLLKVEFSSSNVLEVPMNSILIHWEKETLADAKGMGRYEAITDDLEPTLRPIDMDPIPEETERFLEARKKAFDAIRSTEIKIVETASMSELEEVVQEYLDSYLALLKWSAEDPARARGTARWLLNIDAVKLRLDNSSHAYLVGPTHPLKLAWAALFYEFTINICKNLTSTSNSTSRLIGAISQLASLNLPYNILSEDGEPLINVDNLGPYWSIFIPAGRKDTRSEVAKVRSKLGSSAMDDRFTTISSRSLFTRVARYLYQHPYVNTLVMNIVQPGTGSILVELLMELQAAFPEISFQMNLFAQEDATEEMGAALDDLMAFDRAEKGTAEKDELLGYSKNSLFPKFIYSKHHVNELINHPEEFEAHITVLFDVFQAEVRLEGRVGDLRSSYLGGLLHEFVDSYLNKEGNTYWRRQVLPGTNMLDGLAGTMIEAYRSHDCAIAMTDTSDRANKSELVPTVLLNLGPTAKNLISLVHEVSDWVFTIDRNFGLEYLDDPYDTENPVYVIDQEPDQFSHFGHRFFISTGHMDEADRIVRPVLKELELPDSVPVAESIVYALRSSSSRLLLKLLSSSQASRGALGMALARIYMERSSLLKDMLMIPLDSHTDLLKIAKQDVAARGNDSSGQRTDLLLVELGEKPDLVKFHLVEVKVRSDSSPAALENAKSDATSQLDTSFQDLRELFDPDLQEPDRADRPFLTHELIGLLKDYLERAIRYHLIPGEYEAALYALIDGLENGYTLELTKDALIFSLSSTGLQEADENGVHFRIIGKDRIIADLEAATQAREMNKSLPEEPTYLETRRSFTDRKVGSGLDVAPKRMPLKIEPNKVTKAKDDEDMSKGKEPEPVKTKEDQEPKPLPTIDAKVIIGAGSLSPQMGILGKVWGEKFALDLNSTNAISVFGVQGSGKSYTLGSIIEMALMKIPNLNILQKPLGVIVFHYSDLEEYPPEILSIIQPNEGTEAEKLKKDYEVDPKAFTNVTLLVPETKLEQRQKEFPHINIRPVLFNSTELDSDAWRYLMGATGNDAMYVRVINNEIRRLDKIHKLTWENLWEGIAGEELDKNQQKRASERLEFAKEYIKDDQNLGSIIEPGKLVVVDLRDKYIKRTEAIGLFLVINRIFADHKFEGEPFSKLIVFDEAHNYIGTDFVDDVLSSIRTMRHTRTNYVIASQDPMSVPAKIIELSSVAILHKMIAPNWLKHIKNSVTALGDLAPGDLNMLRIGQAYIWAKESNRYDLQVKAIKVEMRPRVTKHGGETLKAVN
jgi:DNA phosphorothioation-dependent restriction protein DptH